MTLILGDAAASLVLQVGGEQGKGVHGLPQVVAGGRQKAALGLVGPLGGIFFPGQFLRCLADAFFQMFVTGGQLRRHCLHFANLPANEQGADEEDDGDEQAERGEFNESATPVGEQCFFRDGGKNAQIGKAGYGRD